MAVNIPTEHDAAAQSQSEPEDEVLDVGWLKELVLDVAMDAVDLQRTLAARFRKYAATATACRVAWQTAEKSERGTCPFDFTDEDYLAAHAQAFAELESCCVDSPYHALSKKYRCGECGLSIVYCECEYECACGRDLPKRSWRMPPFWGLCACGDPERMSEEYWG